MQTGPEILSDIKTVLIDRYEKRTFKREGYQNTFDILRDDSHHFSFERVVEYYHTTDHPISFRLDIVLRPGFVERT